MSVADSLSALRDAVRELVRAPARPPLWTCIDPARVDRPPDPGTLDPGRDYFEVRINHLHLAHGQKWFSQFTPVVFIAVEFVHDGAQVVVPAMVGPGLIQRHGVETPQGIVVANTRVAGPQPTPPGGLALSVVLYRLQTGNTAQPFLDVLQGAAGSLDLVAGIAPYTALAKVVVGGVDALVGGDQPVLARRDEFEPGLRPAHYALVDPGDGIDPAGLHVREGELAQRVNGRLVPLREVDYVLYSVARVRPENVDVTRLPLYRVWQDVVQQATEAVTDERWLGTKAGMATLTGLLYSSPDLTWEHADSLREQWTGTMVDLRERALRLAHLSDAGTAPDPARARALAVLDL
ncbi:hypothetical protein AB0I82_03790 [Streptomyces sp. NPDC050315]|uniref:hypothetical protein n=1 Tax=Streptomyces sp. NPDC050315 TaxID=3155039 RepID=UPI0034238C0A